MKLIEVTPYVRFASEVRMNVFSPIVTDDSRLFFISQGTGTVNVENTEYAYAPDTLMLWQAGTRYCFTPQTPTTAVILNFDYTAERCGHKVFFHYHDLSRESFLPAQTPLHFSDFPLLNEPLVRRVGGDVTALLDSILTENVNRQPFFEEEMSALLKKILVLLARYPEPPSRSREAVQRVMRYIEENYASDISNKSLAEAVGYHPYYLNKLFLTANGVTLHQYLIRYRLMMAERMLLSTTEPVGQIALAVGFPSTVSFTAAFQKKNGMRPLAYRKTHL